MSFVLGFICGAAVTLYLFYRKAKNMKNQKDNKSFRSDLNNSNKEDF